MAKRLKESREFRESMNKRLLGQSNLKVNRFFTLDTKAHENGALVAWAREIAGSQASRVIRCGDCVAYRVIRGKEWGLRRVPMFEVLNVGRIVRRIDRDPVRLAVTLLDELEQDED